MAYCKNCGAPIDDNVPYCPNCGAPQQVAGEDTGGFGWGLLGFCIPIAGLILFLVWKDTKPNSSRAAGIGALVSVAVSVMLYIITVVLGVAGGILSYM